MKLKKFLIKLEIEDAPLYILIIVGCFNDARILMQLELDTEIAESI